MELTVSRTLLAVTGELQAEWRFDAACAGSLPAYFFPDEKDAKVGSVKLRRARAMCARCPVRLACLLSALGREPREHGVWGGTLEAQRQRARAATHHIADDAARVGEQVRMLDQEFHDLATKGPWRVVSEREWRPLHA